MKKNKGMTLVALAITIIIMLILAGIAINAFIGDHGLFSRAKNATEKYKEAEGNEKEGIDYIDKVVLDEKPQFEDDGTLIDSGLTTMKIRVLAIDGDREDKLTYTLNFGNSEEFEEVYTAEKMQGEEVIFEITGLTKNTKYYWQVKVTDGKSEEVKGVVHNKETNDNKLPIFEDDGTLVEVSLTSMKIRALAKDEDKEDKIKYILKFGESEEFGDTYSTDEKESGEEVIFEINELTKGKTYYWQVEATDGKEEGAKGRLHIEKTESNEVPVFSNPGEAIGVAEKAITISTMATDKDGDDLTYTLRWGTTTSYGHTETKKAKSGVIVEFLLSNLNILSTYYWEIEVTDGKEMTKGTKASTKTKGESPKFTSQGRGTVSGLNTVNITATATDVDTNTLTYTLNWGTSTSYGNKETKKATKGQAVTFTKSGLSYYTPYYWRIDVTDGITTTTGVAGSTRTYCPTTKCEGPFTKTCTKCYRLWFFKTTYSHCNFNSTYICIYRDML